ncbi:MAG: hypothetical protein INQ03_17370 [Candidatus Heimdallarchaeota archaeon]|nr:hypothetical protein [Candidatus Heimdallarchaeota archaeon]
MRKLEKRRINHLHCPTDDAKIAILHSALSVDFANKAFWENGISEIHRMLNELKSLLNKK